MLMQARCAAVTLVLTSRAHAQDLRAVRLLPAEREGALMSQDFDNREVEASPEAPRWSEVLQTEQWKSLFDVAVSGTLLRFLGLKEHLRFFFFFYGKQLRLFLSLTFIDIFFSRRLKSVQCQITTAVILTHDWAHIFLGGAFVWCRQN